jgi:predicted nucleotide-binding protein (sugar kinase/HSP70/actin superfamily)
VVKRLEELGAETIIAPFREWVTYSSYRWGRDSRWKGKFGNVIKAKIQEVFQEAIVGKIAGSVADELEIERDVHLHEMLELCDPYVHKDYDGDPPLAFGAAAALAKQGISGVANILPFTCMPGTLIASVSPSFRKDHDNLPWVNIAYDGQDDSGIQTRMQAFVHQATEFCRRKSLDGRRELPNPRVRPQASHDQESALRAEPAL